MWFKAADPQDLSFLADYEVWGGIPSEPVRLPGLGRYGRYVFDKRLLLSRCDLTIAQKRELIFLSQHFHKLDHFEFFELQPDATERDLKKAYFKLSKELHPDALRGKALGEFGEAARLVFEYGATLYELLSQDEGFRQVYARVVSLRDEAFRAQLEQAREEQRSTGRAAPAPTSTVSQVTPEMTATSEARKAALRERLQKNQARHQAAMEGRPTPVPQRPAQTHTGPSGGSLEGQPSNAKDQAARFFQAGIIAERRKQWVSARGHFKLAVQYAPDVTEYQAGLERVRAVLDVHKADELWSQAGALDEQEQKRGARSKWLDRVAPVFEESLNLKLDPERVIAYANLCVERGFFERGLPLLSQASDAHRFDFNLKWALIQAHERAGRIEDAKALCKEILSYDPSEPRAVAFTKKYGV